MAADITDLDAVDKNLIGAVETSITIIDALKRDEGSSVTGLAQATGYSMASVSKHLKTLKKHGFVTVRDGELELGLRYLELGGVARERLKGSHVIKQSIVNLALETGEVAEYLVESNGRAVVIYREIGEQGIPGRTRVGSQLSMHQVAAGKAMMADMPRDFVEDIIAVHGLERATGNTITEERELFEELERIRDRGYAINDEESTEGLYAIGATTTVADNDLLGACAISGPAYRMKDKIETDRLVDVLQRTTNEIELSLSF